MVKKRFIVDETGASMLYALLFMLVAVMVSVVTISASVSSAKRINDDKVWNQGWLSVNSAADLVKSMVLDMEFNVVSTHDSSGVSSAEVEIVSGELSPIFEDAVRGCAGDLFWSGKTKPFYVDADGFGRIKVSYEMFTETEDVLFGISTPENRYRIVAKVEDEDSKRAVWLDCYQSSVSRMDVTESDGVTTITETVSWDDATVSVVKPKVVES